MMIKIGNLNKLIIVLTLIGVCFGSCKEKRNYALEETEILTKYIEDNNIVTKPTASGLYYIMMSEGSGEKASYGRRVSVHYTGTLLDGTKFDSSFDHDPPSPITFTIGSGQVIHGWDEGLSYMRGGGKARLIIPSRLAYGASGTPSIPAFSTLIFDIELINVVK